MKSYRRILTPSLGSLYSYMLYPLKNAKAFNEGKLSDPTQLGVRAIDARTLDSGAWTSYLLNSMASHYTWWAVHLPTIEKHGDAYRRGNKWTRPATTSAMVRSSLPNGAAQQRHSGAQEYQLLGCRQRALERGGLPADREY